MIGRFGFEDFAGFADTLPESGRAAESLRPHLLRFRASVSGPWPAACSLWAQIYFNTLLILATSLLASDASDDIGARPLQASFCPDSGTPLRFSFCGPPRREPSAGPSLVQRLDSHLGRVIDVLVSEGGLSRRMLWESVDQTLRWTVGEIATNQPQRIPRLERLARDRPPERRLAFPSVSTDPLATPARKFCCLRYRLAGHSACPGLCPRTKARRSPLVNGKPAR